VVSNDKAYTQNTVCGLAAGPRPAVPGSRSSHTGEPERSRDSNLKPKARRFFLDHCSCTWILFFGPLHVQLHVDTATGRRWTGARSQQGEVCRSLSNSVGVCRILPESVGVCRSPAESAGVRRSPAEFVGVRRSLSESVGVRRSLSESGGVCRILSESVGVCRSLPESGGVCRSPAERAPRSARRRRQTRRPRTAHRHNGAFIPDALLTGPARPGPARPGPVLTGPARPGRSGHRGPGPARARP
jgi:hypothetical protein